MATAGDAGAFAIAAIAASSGAGLASPSLVAMLRVDRATASRPRLQSVVNAGTGPGIAIAAALALAVDWRTVWLVAAVVTAGAAVGILVTHRPEPGVEDDADTARVSRGWLRAHAAPIVAAALLGAGSAAAWSFGRTILVDAGATATGSTLAWVALGAGGALAVLTAGVLDRLGPRRAWTATVATVAAATVALAASPGASLVAVVALAAFGWGYTAGTGALIGWTAAIEARHAAAGTAMLFVVLVLGQAVGAAAVGALEPAIGLPAAFVAAALVAVLAAATSATGWSRVRAPADW
ncbi:MFS transporter [Agrococcus sp. SGAir0287]|uniref:MFS transporter n=1 Tax=Agrococcus sp. SGAir0287 TaxID=2070347 RepID=UPI0010F792BC|nr:MFS transporter [Agrococcus sp. SGAir0287]